MVLLVVGVDVTALVATDRPRRIRTLVETSRLHQPRVPAEIARPRRVKMVAQLPALHRPRVVVQLLAALCWRVRPVFRLVAPLSSPRRTRTSWPSWFTRRTVRSKPLAGFVPTVLTTWSLANH